MKWIRVLCFTLIRFWADLEEYVQRDRFVVTVDFLLGIAKCDYNPGSPLRFPCEKCSAFISDHRSLIWSSLQFVRSERNDVLMLGPTPLFVGRNAHVFPVGDNVCPFAKLIWRQLAEVAFSALKNWGGDFANHHGGSPITASNATRRVDRFISAALRT